MSMKITNESREGMAKLAAEGRVTSSAIDTTGANVLVTPEETLVLPDSPKAPKKSRQTKFAPCGWTIILKVPIQVKSEMNMRGHWRIRHKRFELQKNAVAILWAMSPWRTMGLLFSCPLKVTLTHFGKIMDDDNLKGAFKAVRDWLAGIIGVDDGSDHVRWHYDQRLSTVLGIEIRIEKKMLSDKKD